MPQAAVSSRVRLLLRSTSGSFEHEFNRHDRVERVLDEAIRRWGLATTGVTYVIKRQRGNVTMQPAERLTKYDLVNGDLVIIQANQAQDG